MNDLIQNKTINKYIIRQVINGKVIFYQQLLCTSEDFEALKSIFLLPKKDEIIEKCDTMTIMGKDKTGLKLYFSNFALNTNYAIIIIALKYWNLHQKYIQV